MQHHTWMKINHTYEVTYYVAPLGLGITSIGYINK